MVPSKNASRVDANVSVQWAIVPAAGDVAFMFTAVSDHNVKGIADVKPVMILPVIVAGNRALLTVPVVSWVALSAVKAEPITAPKVPPETLAPSIVPETTQEAGTVTIPSAS